MGEVSGSSIVLRNGRSYSITEMDKLRELVEKHSGLLNSVDPDSKTRGFEVINKEGREYSWYTSGDSSQVVEELSTLWIQLTEYARSVNVESLDDEEDDGGMEHKLHEQIVEYFKNGTIPYENYKNAGNAEANWRRKCSPYTLAVDRETLKKDGAIILKRGEVAKAIDAFHRIFGHSYRKAKKIIPKIFFCKYIDRKVLDINASCSCGYVNKEPPTDINICTVNTTDRPRVIIMTYGNTRLEINSIIANNTTQVLPTFSLTEAMYQNELIQARSSSKAKYKIARDGRTLLTLSGAIVLKNDEALNVCMRIHELCGHPDRRIMKNLLSPFVFVQRKEAMCLALSKKCKFCMCRAAKAAVTSLIPIDFRDVKMEIEVYYDEGAEERRFEIIPRGINSKVVDDHVKNNIAALKKYGTWKEPVFSPSGSLARSVLRVVDLLRGNEKEEIENVEEFDPFNDNTESIEMNHADDTEKEGETASETGSIVVESTIDGESGEEEEKIEEDDEESDLEDEELAQMRLELAEKEREAEKMEKEASRFSDATGKMRAYKRQWELSQYLQEQIRIEENPQNRMIVEEDECERGDGSEESEEEGEDVEMKEVKESDKENTSVCDEKPSTSGIGLTKEEKKRLANKKKRDGKKKKRMAGLENPPYDFTPYKANYEEKRDAHPDTTNTVQMERVEIEKREMKFSLCCPVVTLHRDGNAGRKRGRLAQMRREKEQLEKNTKKEEETKVLPVHNPYASAFNGNMWPEEEMEKIRKMREEREKRKEAGLTESEEDDDYE